MEIINKNCAFLSNNEVYTLLKQLKQELTLKLIKKKNLKNVEINNCNDINIDKHLPTIVYESLRYLDKTACVNQSPTVIKEFLRKCNERQKEYKLTKIEKLMLLNLRPSTAVELQYIIEDSEERFTIEQMDELLEFIIENLPSDSEMADKDPNN